MRVLVVVVVLLIPIAVFVGWSSAQSGGTTVDTAGEVTASAAPVNVAAADDAEGTLLDGAVIVDVRPAAEFTEQRLESAVNVPFDDETFVSVVATLGKGTKYLVFGNDDAVSVFTEAGLRAEALPADMNTVAETYELRIQPE